MVLRRPADSYSRANLWDLAGGSLTKEDILKWGDNSGRGDNSDILIKALIRELKEETLLVINEFKPIKSASGFNEKISLSLL